MSIRALLASVALAIGLAMAVVPGTDARPTSEVCLGALNAVACVPPSS